jgi:biotin operon repressor
MELLKTLYLIRCLGSGPLSSAELQAGLEVSRATLNRHIAEARHLGAKITAVQGNRSWLYTLENWPDCQNRVRTWIELEEANSVLQPKFSLTRS